MSLVEKDDWIERLKSTGDTRDEAITELRSILLRGLSAAVRNRYGSKVQAEDVIQDALIKILDKLDTFQGRSKFTTWAMTIAVRTAISEMRRKHFQDVSIDSLLTDNMQFEPAAAAEPSMSDDQELSLIHI